MNNPNEQPNQSIPSFPTHKLIETELPTPLTKTLPSVSLNNPINNNLNNLNNLNNINNLNLSNQNEMKPTQSLPKPIQFNGSLPTFTQIPTPIDITNKTQPNVQFNQMNSINQIDKPKESLPKPSNTFPSMTKIQNIQNIPSMSNMQNMQNTSNQQMMNRNNQTTKQPVELFTPKMKQFYDNCQNWYSVVCFLSFLSIEI